MSIGTLNYKVETILANQELNKHPLLKKNYVTRLTYLTFLSAALRVGKRNEIQVRNILCTYFDLFGILEKDRILLLDFEFNDEKEYYSKIIEFLENYNNSHIKDIFNDSSCKRLLLGEMLLFDLDDSDEYYPNMIVQLYVNYFNILTSVQEEIKSFLIKLVSNKSVTELLKIKRMGCFRYFDANIKNFKKNTDSNSINVTVIATMSSGKSTLLNALIGKRVFPSENKACTSKYLRFTNNPKLLRDVGIASGRYIDSRWNITYDDIIRWNLESDLDRIELKGKMNSYSMLRKLNISFVDTPGTNNSRDRQHSTITKDILQQRNSDVILYVLNATNLASDDDQNLLREVVKNLGTQRIVFLLNKTDQLDLDADDNIADSLNIAREYVIEQGITSPIIIPISSYATGLFRNILEGRPLTNKEERDALTLFRLFQFPEYDMNKYIDKNLLRSLPKSPILARSHNKMLVNSELITSKMIEEAIQKTGIYILERLLLQIKYTS